MILLTGLLGFHEVTAYDIGSPYDLGHNFIDALFNEWCFSLRLNDASTLPEYQLNRVACQGK